MRPLTAIVLVCLAAYASAATLPEGFIETPVASGLSRATAMAFAPDGRLFVCQQGGALRVIKNGALLDVPFVEIPVESSGERGLLGVAFDPDFASNQWVYVYYTATAPTIHNRISRFTANGDVAQAGSEVVILDLDDLGSSFHNGGAIHFGADGKLYAGVGENTAGSNSQSLANLLGKLLRINKDGTIPTDNPFYGQAQGRNRAIWALGLRNPFTFAFQPGTGRMFINDVGQTSWEEINDGIAGANYGWPSAEGNEECSTYQCPLYAYNHSGGACAITGGTFYNPPAAQFPQSYIGKYFFADHCACWIKIYDPATQTVADFARVDTCPVDLQVGPDGRLYYLSGTVAKIAATMDASSPSIVRVDRITGNSAVLHASQSETRQASQWQVDLLGGDFSLPVVDSGTTTRHLRSFNARNLLPTTAYQARVRYQDEDGTWSVWSDPDLDTHARFETLVATAIPPKVLETHPAAGSRGIAVDVSPVLVFNVPVAAASLTDTTVRLVRRSVPSMDITSALSLDGAGQTLTIAPGSLLDPDTRYRIQVAGGRAGIASRDGLIPGRKFATTFFTEPALAASNPPGGATDVPLEVAPQLTFKWEVDPATAMTGTVALVDATSGRRVALASVVASGSTVTVTPAAPLKANHKYMLSVASGPMGLRFADGRQIGTKIKVRFGAGESPGWREGAISQREMNRVGTRDELP